MKGEFKLLLVGVFLVVVACASTKTNSTVPKNIPLATEDDLPSLTKAKIKSYVVPDTIEGNKYIKSHRVYILEDPGSWSKD